MEDVVEIDGSEDSAKSMKKDEDTVNAVDPLVDERDDSDQQEG